MTQLATLFPEPRIVKTRGGEFAVSPITMGRLSAFAKACSPFMAQLTAPGETSLANAKSLLLPLLTEHGDAVLDAVAIGAGIERKQVDALLPDDALALAGAVLEVNLDFFMDQVMPRLASVAGGVAKTRGGSSAGS